MTAGAAPSDCPAGMSAMSNCACLNDSNRHNRLNGTAQPSLASRGVRRRLERSEREGDVSREAAIARSAPDQGLGGQFSRSWSWPSGSSKEAGSSDGRALSHCQRSGFDSLSSTPVPAQLAFLRPCAKDASYPRLSPPRFRLRRASGLRMETLAPKPPSVSAGKILFAGNALI